VRLPQQINGAARKGSCDGSKMCCGMSACHRRMEWGAGYKILMRSLVSFGVRIIGNCGIKVIH
jgi:hypothetical protein